MIDCIKLFIYQFIYSFLDFIMAQTPEVTYLAIYYPPPLNPVEGN